MPTRTDILLHPVRLRIVQALAGRSLTVAQLGQAVRDIPQATLYRHVKKLEDGGLIAAIACGPRGERTFALDEQVGHDTEGELATLDRPDLERLFGAFTASLMADFRRYLERDAIALEADGIGFRTHPLMINDEELTELAADLRALIARYSNRPESPDRKRRKLSLIFLPDTLQETP